MTRFEEFGDIELSVLAQGLKAVHESGLWCSLLRLEAAEAILTRQAPEPLADFARTEIQEIGEMSEA